MKKVDIAPSILSANFLYLGKEIKDIEEGGATYIHFDVMDGTFVNNISFGLPVLKSVSKITNIKIDSHLMIVDPLKYYERFYNSGSYNVTVHLETVSVDDFKIISDFSKRSGKSVGISINPETNLEKIIPYLEYVNIVLVMSVTPGFGGQSFKNESLDKIKFLKEYRETHHLNYLIEVDGGINETTSKLCIDSGADILVAGSFIFLSDDYKEKIKELKHDCL